MLIPYGKFSYILQNIIMIVHLLCIISVTYIISFRILRYQNIGVLFPPESCEKTYVNEKVRNTDENITFLMSVNDYLV